MAAIYRREVKGFLNSMTGYLFIAFILLVTGIYFTAYHLRGAYPAFSYTLESIVVILLIAVPILTMRVLAEERRQKTDQLLLTSPVSVPGIVVGKYLALVTIFLIPILILAVYPLILLQFGNVSLPGAYSALAGLFLLGSSFLAVGLYLSSITENQVIAAVLTFLVLFVFYVMNGISGFFPETASASFFALVVAAAAVSFLIYYMTAHALITAACFVLAEAALTALFFLKPAVYEGLIQKILGVFAVTEKFSEFTNGIFDLGGVVYYLSIIVICLFLTVQSIQKRRWS